jgi:hypothetical protein
MSGQEWTDRIVGDRMAVDREFTDRIEASEFSSQQWGLIMTATEFEIDHPADDERAQLVANTEKLPAVLPELDRIDSQAGAMGAGGGSGSGGSGGSDGGVFGSIKRAIGLDSGGGDAERTEAAERLTGEYASELQRRLEERGKWAEIRALAAE